MRSYPGMRDIRWPLRGTYNAVFCLGHYFPKSDLVQNIKATSRKWIYYSIFKTSLPERDRFLITEVVAIRYDAQQ